MIENDLYKGNGHLIDTAANAHSKSSEGAVQGGAEITYEKMDCFKSP